MRTALRTLRSLGPVMIVLTAACATLPTDYPPPPETRTLEPDGSTTLGRNAAGFARISGFGVSGFAPIDANGEALRIRLAMIDSAERSLDMLYYVWYDDPSGLLVLEHVIAAAEHGVRVRVVVDDTLFIKGKKGLGDLDAHPNIEIRIFNPWASAGVARAFETAARAKKLNTRMHNKLLVADGKRAIFGGRNVADELPHGVDKAEHGIEVVRREALNSPAGPLEHTLCSVCSLFDVEADPHEGRNLADDPQYADKLAEMKARLKEFQRATDDAELVLRIETLEIGLYRTDRKLRLLAVVDVNIDEHGAFGR